MDETSNNPVDDGGNVEMAPLTATKKVEDSEELVKGVSGDRNLAPISNFFNLLLAYASYGIHYAPRVCLTLAIFGLIVPSYYIIAESFFNPIEHFGDIEHDYSNLNIQSNFDSQLRNIDYWCLQGDNNSCQCEDPTQPAPRFEYRRWTNAHAGNVMQIENMIKQDFPSPDIAFLGGSVIERMDGRWFGNFAEEGGLNDVRNIFEKRFNGKDGALSAVALGIAADMNQSVLWRILNGEMPSLFNPKIWWLELGLNDLGRGQCSEEIVVIGILRIVEEIMQAKPDAKIVINSVFPMSDLRGGLAPTAMIDLRKGVGREPNAKWKKQIIEIPKNDPGNFNKQDLKKRSRVFDKKEIGQNLQGSGGRDFPSNKKGVTKTPKNNGRNAPKNNGKNASTNNGKNASTNAPKNNGRNGAGNDNARTFLRERTLRDRDGFRNRNREIEKLLDRTSQHKFNPVTRAEQKLPFWTSIRSINVELRKFCDKNANVHCFDSTSIFTEKDGKDYYLKTDMITRRGLPTNDGYIAWENAVAISAKTILGYPQ